MKSKSLVFIPTYNEKGNVLKLYNHIKSLPINLDILFIDDSSPDGTGILLDDGTYLIVSSVAPNALGDRDYILYSMILTAP